ncbi:MAG: thioredoxin domain-containing protein [Candidatus Nomurabacteria bacterium]|jgi:protein-disulfide isomerase|nr:thioredoxin domain-containing protein [Candidatus Nomurabacteria bacterium]
MQNLDIGRIVRWSLAIVAIGLVVALFVWNAVTPQTAKSVETWQPEMTFGSPQAVNHFIEYVDMMCPYCAKFYLALHDSFDDFQRDFIDTDKIYYELRLVDIVSEHSQNSYRGNIAGYCAARQPDKFWGFYETMQNYLTDNYYSKGIGDKKGAPEIPKWDNQVFYDQAEQSDLNMDEFRDCFDTQQPKDTLATNTRKAQISMQTNSISGVPYFIFNDYTSSGFEGNYSTIQRMFKAGGVN